MTNTKNTPVEALEYAYPLRVRRYEIRPHTGGRGKHRGGDGLIREIEALAPARAALLTERRMSRPYGLAGGGPGEPGVNSLLRAADDLETPIPGKAEIELEAGDVLKIATPGGGGYGKAGEDR